MTRADTEQLLQRAAKGDDAARQQLITRHQQRLCQMVAFHMDRRLAPRFDPSDVVQEALIEANGKLSDYLRQRPVPFYPWLREIAWQRLVKFQRRHLHAGKRSVRREEPQGMLLSDESALELADRLAAKGSSPSDQAIRGEVRRRVQNALALLSAPDRELLVLRYLEQLPLKDIACVMKTTEGAVRIRHVRALQRLHGWLDQKNPGGQP